MCQIFGINYTNLKKGEEQQNLRCAYRPLLSFPPLSRPGPVHRLTSILIQDPHVKSHRIINQSDIYNAGFSLCAKYLA